MPTVIIFHRTSATTAAADATGAARDRYTQLKTAAGMARAEGEFRAHTIHGIGVFTYMNGWFLWDQCR